MSEDQAISRTKFMPRYRFDIDDGRQKIADKEGSDLSDHRQAREEAVNVLLEFAREGLMGGDQRTFLCKVRDEADMLILTVSVSLNAEWSGGQQELGT